MNIEAFFKLTYGLYVVSSGNKNEKSAYIANTAFQVTAEPAQMAISCHKDNHTSSVIQNSGAFSVSVLRQEASSELIGLFGYKSSNDTDKLKNIEYDTGQTGVPIVKQECLSWFECKIVQSVDVGTHTIFIGEVVGADIINNTEEPPLTYAYYREVKHGLAPENAPTYVDKSKIEDKKESKDKTKQTTKNNTEKKNSTSKSEVKKHRCLVCGYIYNPESGDATQGIAPGTPFEDLPEEWECPICSATQDMFEEE